MRPGTKLIQSLDDWLHYDQYILEDSEVHDFSPTAWLHVGLEDDQENNGLTVYSVRSLDPNRVRLDLSDWVVVENHGTFDNAFDALNAAGIGHFHRIADDVMLQFKRHLEWRHRLSEDEQSVFDEEPEPPRPPMR